MAFESAVKANGNPIYTPLHGRRSFARDSLHGLGVLFFSVKFIPLKSKNLTIRIQTRFAIVDDEDYERLLKHIWYYNKGYAVKPTEVNYQRMIAMHRIILNPPANMEVDHINGNKLDNRKDNLRSCFRFQNARNRKFSSNSTSGFKGVYFCKTSNKYRALICARTSNGKSIQVYLGTFDTPEVAHSAYASAAEKYHAEFASTALKFSIENQLFDLRNNYMPTTEPIPSIPDTNSDGPKKLSSIVRHAMRFYDVDDKAVVELRKAIAHVSDDTFKDIIRKAVHAGLPVIQKQWEPIIKQKAD